MENNEFEITKKRDELNNSLKNEEKLPDSSDFIYLDKNENEKVDIDKVAKYIIEKYELKTIYGLREEIIYAYDNGIWESKGRGLIKSEIEKLLNNYSKNNVVNEILEKVKRMTAEAKEIFDIEPEFKRCLKNGVLDFKNIENICLLPHSKEYHFKFKIPIDYNPEAKCPNCLQFINDTFYPEDVPQFQEWIGHHLPKRYMFKKAVIIHGPINTGKSVLVNLMSNFLGINNISGVSLQKISKDKGFDIIALKDKVANIVDDLSSNDLSNAGGFKMAVGDGFITGEEKFGDHFRFRNSAKNTFTCNQIPSLDDINDWAFYSRFLVWIMDNIVEEEEKDPYLIDKLTTPEEISGLLNWAIEGYKRLVKQNKFSNEKKPEEIKDLMVRNSSPLAQFAKEILIKEEGNKISKEIMYRVYCEYCEKHNPQLSPCSKEQLGRQLTRFAPFALASSDGNERYWINTNFNPQYTDTYYTIKNNMSLLLEDVYSSIRIFPKASYVSEKDTKANFSDKPKQKQEKILGTQEEL